ncbi:MAG: hypothetical protein WC428_07980 [Candidatus Paceibacterota bacterium]
MDISEAREIYANCIDGKNPKRYSKEQIYECLNVLNNAAQPVQLGRMQFLAIQDAIARVNGENPRLP